MSTYTKVALLSLSLLLVGCETESAAELEDVSLEEQKEAIYESDQSGDAHYLSLVERAEPIKAGISHSAYFGSISTDFLVEVSDTETLKFILDDMIEGSERQFGIVNMAEPDYGLQINYEDGSSETFHLWVSSDYSSGTLMDTSETHYIYNFSKEASKQFLSLLAEEDILE
ncbi:hypothetical protein [Alkalibacterium olivapovliticus]|uniref:YhfM-like domain-containing protein n=1 Tax=Alkalibacterium olivapovliticus TaxID=99907 RepID=A0A2T0W8C6_9LACT|nr:hypothetical protein [Alkalibacterium olivapovliticus]PRY82967.1 hypothetical protein CLV38_10741 [Alkalibacterium olivapovliticus]